MLQMTSSMATTTYQCKIGASLPQASHSQTPLRKLHHGYMLTTSLTSALGCCHLELHNHLHTKGLLLFDCLRELDTGDWEQKCSTSANQQDHAC